MTPGISLYEFLPYGAPELHESARGNLSRATVLSSALMVLVYFVCLGIAPRFGDPEPRPIPFPGAERMVDLNDPRILEPPPLVPPAPQSAPASKAADGFAAPVPDAAADPEATIPSRESGGPAPLDGAGGEGTRGEVGEATPARDGLPGPEDAVYVEELPEPIVEVDPVYPEIAREARVEGMVLTLVLVGKDGRVLDVRIAPNHSVPLLDPAAEEAARRWVFTPALANGRPVVVWMAVPFRFTLH